jgi:hypothetical protein
MFKRTSLPVARSIHYQLIDIQLDEVQQMVHSNDGQVRRRRKKKLFLSFSYLNKIIEGLFHDRRVVIYAIDKHSCRLLIRRSKEKSASRLKQCFACIKKKD